MKRIYLSGPITGMDNLNREAFAAEEQRLSMLGYKVVNPHRLFNEHEQKTFTWLKFMVRCVTALEPCDTVATLEGWDSSEGAKIEVLMARIDNKPVVSSLLITKPVLEEVI